MIKCPLHREPVNRRLQHGPVQPARKHYGNGTTKFKTGSPRGKVGREGDKTVALQKPPRFRHDTRAKNIVKAFKIIIKIIVTDVIRARKKDNATRRRKFPHHAQNFFINSVALPS